MRWTLATLCASVAGCTRSLPQEPCTLDAAADAAPGSIGLLNEWPLGTAYPFTYTNKTLTCDGYGTTDVHCGFDLGVVTGAHLALHLVFNAPFAPPAPGTVLRAGVDFTVTDQTWWYPAGDSGIGAVGAAMSEDLTLTAGPTAYALGRLDGHTCVTGSFGGRAYFNAVPLSFAVSVDAGD